MKVNRSDYAGVYLDGGLGPASRERFLKRRRRLAARFDHPIVVAAPEIGPGEENVWTNTEYRVYQEPLLMYLSGINQKGIILLLDKSSKFEKEILYLPKYDSMYEHWLGRRFCAGDLEQENITRTVTGIKTIRPLSCFRGDLVDHVKKAKGKKTGLFWLDGKGVHVQKDSNYSFKKKVSSILRAAGLYSKKRIVNIAWTQLNQRLCLDERDELNVRKANVISTLALKKLLPAVSRMKTEYEAAGKLDGAIRETAPWGQAFPTIAASGRNAMALHYDKPTGRLKKDRLLLLDFGARYYSMNADISRTVPVSGRFNPLQKLLYNIVLSAQRLVQKSTRAGITIKKLNKICWEYIEKRLKTEVLDKGGRINRAYEERPHGVSHLIGESVHDGDHLGVMAGEKLKKGMLISNEPGIYGSFELEIKGKLYREDIGIRIEDDLLITAQGCRNLTSGCPKSISEIEKAMKKSR